MSYLVYVVDTRIGKEVSVLDVLIVREFLECFQRNYLVCLLRGRLCS